MSQGATHEGRKLIAEWQSSAERVAQARSELTRAMSAEEDARKSLANWMLPKDAQQGEKFSIWERDHDDQEVLFEVTKQVAGITPEIRRHRRT